MMGTGRDPELRSQSGGEEDGDPAERSSPSPWNIMIKHHQVQRRGRRAHVSVSFTDPAVSMDLLRAVLQPSINEEIQNVFNKYMMFFQKAALNVRENVGDQVDPEQLIRDTCHSCLEQAKGLFTDKKIMKTGIEVPAMKQPRQVDEESNMRRSPIPKKRKGRPPVQTSHNDRNSLVLASLKIKTVDPIRREGPKWDPSRLDEKTTFVLGSRANKALGMGGTRGRIYTKHPELFKYAADAQDKQWLTEQQHMKATGGKMVYLLLDQDILDLATTDEYRDSLELRLDELKQFVVPLWMTVKMKKYMELVRTEQE
ncbi:LOW QUALITY PROTEIN: deoxynucleotidyltransferase terminal-interacting protein 1-like [Rana temporaria]|uniref:LOW QUALITY PROTEIN: deoxynucleotidyltransferase terminal-interacting protein 1-like n=1 Tax=Rana temporaria TaxID=8407 RepID=UPI001AAD82B6|nr:LOW QUALITY PROTEIN: deoxynucleotidyltransferase terminal-interacting protein 1-like [Rana temporaria]